MMTVYFLIAGILACIIMSAFFSGSEMALSAANEIRLENLSEDGDRKAGATLKLVRNFDDILSTILIGNNLVNIASSSLVSVLFITVFGSDTWSWVGTVILTVVVIIFGETIPKITAKRNATKRAVSATPVISVLRVVFYPVTRIIVGLVHLLMLPFGGEKEEEEDPEESVEELQNIIETAEDEGILDSDDTELLQNAIDFAEVSASEAMTARVDVQAIDIEDDWQDILAFVENTPFSRIPVYESSIDNIIGIIHLNTFLQHLVDSEGKKFDLRPMLMEPCYVYKTMKLPSVLAQMRNAKQHLAIVTDEYSGTLGVITMEDVLEQVVGEIWDETDTVEDEVKVLSETSCEIDGDMPISEFFELEDMDEDSFEFESETVGGWTVEQFDRFPEEGESFEFRGIRITVLKMDGRRVDRVLAEKISG